MLVKWSVQQDFELVSSVLVQFATRTGRRKGNPKGVDETPQSLYRESVVCDDQTAPSKIKIPNYEVVWYKEWPGKIIYLNFDSIFGDFFLKFFEEEVSDYLSWPDSYVLYVCAHNYAQNFHQGDCMQSSSKVVDSKFSI